jgi:hypothetical protein
MPTIGTGSMLEAEKQDGSAFPDGTDAHRQMHVPPSIDR